MSTFEAWIADCHLQKDGEDYRCQAAVWVAGYNGFRASLDEHVAGLGYRVLWLEECHPAPQYIARHGKQREIGALARQVHENHLVELGPMQGMASAPKSYLAISDHQIPPLPDQSGLPFWDKEWIAPELKSQLFSQPDKGPKLRTYCIINASLRKHVSKVFDLDSTSIDLPIQCLFKGNAAQELKEVAPYLIDMTLPDGAYENRDLVPRFHKDLFAKYWGKNSGVFIRTPALMAEVWGHFRKFTKTAMQEDGKIVFFLFHDPRILPDYLRNIAEDSGKTRCFATTDQGAGLTFLIEQGATGVFKASPELELLAEVPRPRFVLSYEDFKSQAEAEKLKKTRRIAERIHKDFAKELEGRNLSETAEFALKITNRFNEYGFIKQEHMHFFVAWSLFFGEGFERKDPEGVLGEICQSKAPEDERFMKFKARFDGFSVSQKEAS